MRLIIILQTVDVPLVTPEIHSQFVGQLLHHHHVSCAKLFERKHSNCVLLGIATVQDDPCNPSPCGPNAQCDNGICSCLPEYQGDPYSGCRPECVLNSDCSRELACIQNKCRDPCPGTCATNALCQVINHIPICTCPTGMAGNAFVQCSPKPRKYL